MRAEKLEQPCLVVLENNKMEAYLEVYAEGCSPEKVFQLLKEKSVVYGVDEEKIRSIDYSKPGRYLIAKGTPPKESVDAKIVYHFLNKRREEKMKLEDAAKVDYREMLMIDAIFVEEGELLAEKIPPVEGEPGINVCGEQVPARVPKDLPLRAGKNVEVSEDGLKLYAAVDGQVVMDGGRIKVLEVLNINGDVDFSVGNLDFGGSITITGSVMDGFVVRAKGDVFIGGSVEAAVVECEGNLTIKRGIYGRDNARITVGGDLRVRTIEKAQVTVKGDLYFEQIRYAEVKCYGSAYGEGAGKSAIVGGRVVAAENIEVDIIGSSMGTRTEVALAPSPELKERMEELKKEIEEAQEQLAKVEPNIEILKRQEKTLSEEKREIYFKLLKAKFQLEKTIREGLRELEDLEKSLSQYRAGVIKVRKQVYPKVKITIKGVNYYVDEIMIAPSFREERGEIVVGRAV